MNFLEMCRQHRRNSRRWFGQLLTKPAHKINAEKTSILKVLIDHIHLYEHLAQRAVWRIFILWTIKKKKEFSSLDFATEVYRKILKPMLCSSALNQWQAGFRYSNATLWLALTVICQFYSCRTRNRKVRISIGFSVTSHGEGSLTPRGRGFDFFSERLTRQAFKCFNNWGSRYYY